MIKIKKLFLIITLLISMTIITGCSDKIYLIEKNSTTINSNSAQSVLCTINIKSSSKNIVNWDIKNSDNDIVTTHCDFSQKKIFGGEIN